MVFEECLRPRAAQYIYDALNQRLRMNGSSGSAKSSSSTPQGRLEVLRSKVLSNQHGSEVRYQGNAIPYYLGDNSVFGTSVELHLELSNRSLFSIIEEFLA